VLLAWLSFDVSISVEPLDGFVFIESSKGGQEENRKLLADY